MCGGVHKCDVCWSVSVGDLCVCVGGCTLFVVG